MATVDPSELNDTAEPDSSSWASPSMSPPTCTHAPPVRSYTRTCPERSPLLDAPMATRVPSELSDTAPPDSSLAASPSMSLPTCVHSVTAHAGETTPEDIGEITQTRATKNANPTRNNLTIEHCSNSLRTLRPGTRDSRQCRRSRPRLTTRRKRRLFQRGACPTLVENCSTNNVSNRVS